MPSLRRSFSSPSVRSSPYPPSLSTPIPASASASASARARAPAPHPRRSSGPTAERRVLADIEWWRVYDGQCDPYPQGQPLDDVQALESDTPPGGIATLTPGGGSVEPRAPQSLSSDTTQSIHANMFAVLSIAPHSPGHRGQDLSVESTPELHTAPLETVQLYLADPMTPPFGLYSSPIIAGGRQSHPFFGLRAVSAPSPSRPGTYEPPDFADMGGDSFSLEQNLFR